MIYLAELACRPFSGMAFQVDARSRDLAEVLQSEAGVARYSESERPFSALSMGAAGKQGGTAEQPSSLMG